MASSLRYALGDLVTLVKQDGQTLEDIPAQVSRGEIIMAETSLPIEDGDTLVRQLPNNRTEEYLVLDAGFLTGHGSIPSFYDAKVRKKTAIDARPPAQVVYNLGNVHVSGDNARFNLHSADLSTNVVDVGADELFEKLKQALREAALDDERRFEILAKVASMQKAAGSPTFAERYKDFVATAADHITLLAPFIPALTQLLH